MSEDTDRSLDVFGIKPVADAAKILVEGGVKGGGKFLSAVCMPAAEEYGLLWRDRVSQWRQTNAEKTLAKARDKVGDRMEGVLNAHPRLALLAIQESSLSDDDDVQDMWAGLLASSCVSGNASEENLVFMNILKDLSPGQARMVNYAVEACGKFVTDTGYVVANHVTMPVDEFISNVGCSDSHIADVQVDSLFQAGLLLRAFDPDTMLFALEPSPLCISFYVRCQGYVGAPRDYWPDLPVQRVETIAPEEGALENAPSVRPAGSVMGGPSHL